MWKNSKTRFGVVATILHWLVALLLVGLFALGWYMMGLTYYDPGYKLSFDLHKMFGLLALLLALIRIGWSLYDRQPDFPLSMKPWEVSAARWMHRTLHLMAFLIPVSGYLISTADGHAIDIFGLFEVPAVLPPADGREELAGRIHYLLAFGTAYLVLGHMLAAFKHQFIDHDKTLSRMLGGKVD